MRYDELTQMVTGSSPQDWEVIGPPVYLDRLGEVESGDGQHWLEVESHYHVAVYKPDVSLRLAWGLRLDREKLLFEGWKFEDGTIYRYLVDAFWQGALTARWTVVSVDGGHCYLPDPSPAYVTAGESLQDYMLTGWTAKPSEIALARLVDNLERSPSKFDSYFQRAGIIEVPEQ